MKAMALVPSTPSTELHLPPLIAGAGDRAARRFLEFFIVNIRNKNTRAAYARAAGAFLRWCEDRSITRIEDVQFLRLPWAKASQTQAEEEVMSL